MAVLCTVGSFPCFSSCILGIVLRGFRGLIDVWSSRCSQLVLSTCLLGVIWDMLAFEKVAVLRILLHRRNLGGGIPVSASSAEVDVVLKHPVIAIIARRCTMASFWVCSIVGALL